MSSPRKQWLLKVVAGPHAGAEIGLYAGKTLIGSDDECDVVLHDVLVAPQHLELDIAESGMTAAPLGGRVFTNGKRIREARQAVPEYGFLSIGGTHLVIGPADGKWPLLTAADVPTLEKEVEAPPPEAETQEPAPEAAAAPAPVTPIVVPGGTPTPPRPAPSRASAMVGVALGCIILIGWFFIYRGFVGGDKNSSRGSDSPMARAHAIIEEMGVVGQVKVEEAGGRITASGYVETENKQRDLQAAFREQVPGLRTKIYSQEKIASSARSLIDAERLPLTVSGLPEGKVRVAGKLSTKEPWQEMRQTLMQEVPGLTGIEDEVKIDVPRPQAPNTVFVPVPTPVPVAADAPQTMPQPAAAVPAAPAPPAPVEPDYFVTKDTIDTPDATIAAIHTDTDGLGWVRLSSGGVYFVGARLPYGGSLMAIDEESVTVIERGAKRELRLGDLVMKAQATTSSNAP